MPYLLINMPIHGLFSVDTLYISQPTDQCQIIPNTRLRFRIEESIAMPAVNCPLAGCRDLQLTYLSDVGHDLCSGLALANEHAIHLLTTM